MSSPFEDQILGSLRRITRAIDLYSRQLAARYGLTGPQLVCMRALEALGPSTPSTLARHVDLSQATMTGILDRLEQNGLVRRERNQDDRRRVTVSLTESGAGLLGRAPSALTGERGTFRLEGLTAGRWRLYATAAGGHLTTHEEVTVSDGGSTVTLVLEDLRRRQETAALASEIWGAADPASRAAVAAAWQRLRGELEVEPRALDPEALTGLLVLALPEDQRTPAALELVAAMAEVWAGH